MTVVEWTASARHWEPRSAGDTERDLPCPGSGRQPTSIEQVTISRMAAQPCPGVAADSLDPHVVRPCPPRNLFHKSASGAGTAQVRRCIDIRDDKHIGIAAVVGEHDLPVDIQLKTAP